MRARATKERVTFEGRRREAGGAGGVQKCMRCSDAGARVKVGVRVTCFSASALCVLLKQTA